MSNFHEACIELKKSKKFSSIFGHQGGSGTTCKWSCHVGYFDTSFRYLEHQNLSIISEDIDKKGGYKNKWGVGRVGVVGGAGGNLKHMKRPYRHQIEAILTNSI